MRNQIFSFKDQVELEKGFWAHVFGKLLVDPFLCLLHALEVVICAFEIVIRLVVQSSFKPLEFILDHSCCFDDGLIRDKI